MGIIYQFRCWKQFRLEMNFWCIHQKFIWAKLMLYFLYENGKLLASSPYRGSHSANQQMHFLIDLKGISVNGVELLIISVTLIVNQKVNQMGIPCLCHLNCLEFFKIVVRLEISWLVYHIKCWLATNVFLLIDWQEHEYQSTWFLWKFILCTNLQS